LALASSLVLTACGGTDTTQSTSKGSAGPPAEYSIATQGPVTTFDPWSAPSGYNGNLFAMIGLYDSLVHLDEAGKPTPWLATKWETPDPSNYTLTLRSDVKFTDGTALNADAVVKNVEYAQKAQTPGECNSYLTGAAATAKDATTVSFALKTPNVGFLTDLGACAGFVVNPKAFADPNSLKTTPAGSGPYVLDTTNSVQGQKSVMVRNPNYWAKDSYQFDTINLVAFADANAAANAAKSGQVDMIQSVDLAKDTSGLAPKSLALDFRGLMIHDLAGKDVKALGDKRVRQAMQMAIDRQGMLTSLYGNSGQLGLSTPFPQGVDGYTDLLKDTFPYDPAKAKQLLADAGYPNGFTVKVMVFSALYGDAAQAIAGYLKEIGITLQISDHSNDYIPQLQTGVWPMAMFNWTIGTSAIHTYQGLTDPNGFWNVRHNQSPAMQSLLDQISKDSTDADRKPLLAQLAKQFQDDSWFLVPVLVKGGMAYNDKKLSVKVVQGSPVAFLYQITKA
jgi:peptide/nickel transport system substrate-binding protein